MAKKTVVEKIKEALKPVETPVVEKQVKGVCENCKASGRYCYQCSDPKVVDSVK